MVLSAVLAASSGCATTANPKHQEDLDSVKKALGALATRVDAMEGRIAAPKAQAPVPLEPLKTVGVTPHPAEGAGTDVPPLPAVTDPEPGFVNDDAVQEYRRAMVYFEAGRFGEAISGFSTFLEKFPDHPFAGSAQFYVGESHMNQKEYPQAYEEFQRVLTTYDRSSHVAATLRELAVVEEMLQKKDDAARHRHLLNSLFPQSPAAQLALNDRKAPVVAPVVAPVEENAPEAKPKAAQKTQEDAARLDEPPPPTAP